MNAYIFSPSALQPHCLELSFLEKGGGGFYFCSSTMMLHEVYGCLYISFTTSASLSYSFFIEGKIKQTKQRTRQEEQTPQ